MKKLLAGLATALPFSCMRRILFLCSQNKLRSPTAETLFADRNNMWNAGVFLASCKTLTEAFRTHAQVRHDHAPFLLTNTVKALGKPLQASHRPVLLQAEQ